MGWRGDIKNAWHIVLGVLGIGEDGRPLSVDQMADQMATAARNDCDARATAARNECDATTEEYEHDDDLAALPRYYGPNHHIDDTLLALASAGRVLRGFWF